MLDRIDIKYFKLAVGTSNLGTETDVDISARCPVCGDSSKTKSKKRLHLYIKGNVTQVNCFNGGCAVQNKTVYSFLRDFYPTLLDSYKRETFKTKISNLHESGDVFSSLAPVEKEVKPEVQTYNIQDYVKPIHEVPEAIKYLQKRMFNYQEQFGKWYFGTNNLKIHDTVYSVTNSIIIPLYFKSKIYGFYSRNISNKFFCTFNSEENIGYKVWNWFNIDKSQPVYIFEGIFDAISSGFNNIIALMGAKLPEERLKELKQPVFVLDNDRTGIINSIEYSRRGYSVYVQPDHILEKDMNEVLIKHPDIIIKEMIQQNIFSGISAEVRLKNKI